MAAISGRLGRRPALLVAGVVIVGILGTGFWFGAMPKLADEFHFAFPGRLPNFVGHSGRDYEDTLAYETGRVRCYRLEGESLPLRRVGTLFGFMTSSRPKLVSANTSGLPTVIYVPDHEDCYRSYALLGGP